MHPADDSLKSNAEQPGVISVEYFQEYFDDLIAGVASTKDPLFVKNDTGATMVVMDYATYMARQEEIRAMAAQLQTASR